MIDLALLAGRVALIALLFLFLFVVMRTGIGLVRGQTKKGDGWTIAVEQGPRELRGVRLNVAGPVVVGRAVGADIVIPATYVSGRHARFSRLGDNLILEDLGSTNGTTVNGEPVGGAVQLLTGDTVGIGEVTLRVGRG